MDKAFHQQNRQELYRSLPADSLLLLFSGRAPRKTSDEDYPFFADRSFVYYTGVEQADSVLAACKGGDSVSETLFLLPKDDYLERWNGRRLSPEEAPACDPAAYREEQYRTLAAALRQSLDMDRIYRILEEGI